MTAFLAPDPIQSTFFIPGTNTPGSGVQVFFYVNLSSTKTTVYKDPAQATAWSNPIVLDSGGNLPSGGQVWIPSGVTCTVKYCPANDSDPPTSPYLTLNYITGMNDVSMTATEWVVGPTPTFISSTSFSVVGDQTSIFTLGRRVRTSNTSGTVYSTVTSVGFSVGVTTVRVVNDSGSLDSGISAVSYSFLDASNPSIDYYYVARDGGTVASASTTDIWGVPGIQLHLNSTTPIGSFSSASYAGAYRTVITDTAIPLIHSSILSIPGGQNVTTNVGDRFGVIASTQSAAVITWYQSNLLPLIGSLPGSSQVYSGPVSGAAAAPSFRALAGAESVSSLLCQPKIASNTTAVNFSGTDFDWTAWDTITFEAENMVPTTNNASAGIRLSTDGGTTFDNSTTAYGLANTVLGANGSSYSLGQIASLITLVGTGNAVNSTFALGGYGGTFTLHKPTRTSTIVKTFDHIGAYSGSIVVASVTGGGATNDNQLNSTAINGLQFLFSAGSISSAIFYARGYRKA